MRKLTTCDAFNAMRLIKESGVKDDIKRIALSVNNGSVASLENIGADFIFSIIEGLSRTGAEKMFYEFLAGPLEMTVDEVKNVHPTEWKNIFEEYKKIEDAESWKSFFEFVASLIR